jgi:hypothetical protein
VLENLLSFYHQSFGIIDSKTVQFDFNFTGSGSDFHDASKTCKFKISIFDTINNKVIYTCPQVFIYHEYDQE